MVKVLIQTFILDGTQYSFHSEKGSNFKVFISEDDDTILITNSKNEVWLTVRADCAQNQGFLKIED